MMNTTTIVKLLLAALYVAGLQAAPSLSASPTARRMRVSRTENFIFVWALNEQGQRRFEVVFSRTAAGIGGVFDSENDPQNTANLAATVFRHDTALVAFSLINHLEGERGLYYPAPPQFSEKPHPLPGLWVSVLEDGAHRPDPAQHERPTIPDVLFPRPDRFDLPEPVYPGHRFEITEESPQRIKVVIAGHYSPEGRADNLFLPLQYETEYTLYPTGRIFVRHAIEYRGPRFARAGHLVSFNAAGVDDYETAGSIPIDPKRLDYATTGFILYRADTPRYRTDLLLIPQESDWPVFQWAKQFASAGGKERYLRSRIVAPRDDNGFGPSRFWWNLLIDIGRRDLDSEEAAAIAGEFRHPAGLRFLPEWGGIDALAHDTDGRGFDAGRGVYRLQSGLDGVAFHMDGGRFTRRAPAFEIAGWNDRVPQVIEVARLEQRLGRDYLARIVRDEVEAPQPADPYHIPRPQYRLYLQFLKLVRDDGVRFVIRKSDEPLAEPMNDAIPLID